MKGLFVKDLKLLSKSARSYVIILLVVIVWMTQLTDSNESFIIGYTAMMAGIFITNTITMDTNGGSLPYLMTLPGTRKTYVIEKYLLIITGTFLFSMLIAFGCMALNPNRWIQILIEGVAIFATISFYHMIMVPLQLKYNEKSRIALLGILGGAILTSLLISNLANKANSARMWISLSAVKNAVIDFAERVLSWNKIMVIIVLCWFWFLCWGVSIFFSIRIMQKKEF